MLLDMETRAGGSELRRRQQAINEREYDVRRKHPFIGGAILAITRKPKKARRLARRAADAKLVGAALDPLTDLGMIILHDRAVPGTDGSIEQVVIGNNGVTIIRSTRRAGRLNVTKKHVLIGGNKATIDIEGLMGRVNTARHLLGGEAEVQGALCMMTRRSLRLKSFKSTVIGSVPAVIEHLTQLHNEHTDSKVDIVKIATEMDGVFVPADMLS
jgi:hypothetical protein